MLRNTPNSWAIWHEIRACTLPCLVKKRALLGQGKDGLVPDAGVNVQTPAGFDIKRHEVPRRDVIAGQGQGHDERSAVDRRKELAAVGVIVGVPEQDPRAVWRRVGPVGRRELSGVPGPAQQVLVVDGLVATEKDLAVPPDVEVARGRASLVPGPRVDRPPPQRGPGDDLDREVSRDPRRALRNRPATPAWPGSRAPHAREARGNVGLQVVDRPLRAVVWCGCHLQGVPRRDR